VINMIELRKISRHFSVGNITTKAIDNVSLKIESGELVAIVGTSGSGKSTLMHILGCLDTEYDGEYILDCENIKKMSKSKTARIRNNKIGFIFQKYHLIPELSVYENVELPLIYANILSDERKKHVEFALERVGLLSKAKNLPNQLSGGQQQRVSIARALINNPSIILADEPTGALDSKTGKEIMQLIKSLNDLHKTIILVTHDMDLAQEMSRIITLSDGKIVSDIWR